MPLDLSRDWRHWRFGSTDRVTLRCNSQIGYGVADHGLELARWNAGITGLYAAVLAQVPQIRTPGNMFSEDSSIELASSC